MGYFIMFLGFAAIFVFLVIGIFDLLRRNGRAKKSFLAMLIGFIVMVIGIISIPKNDDADTTHDKAKTTQVSKKSSLNKKHEPANRIGYKLNKRTLKKQGYVWVPKDTTDLKVQFSVGENKKINGAKITEHATRTGMLKYFKKVTASDLKEVDDPNNPDLYYSKKLNKYYHVGNWEDSNMKNVYKSAQLNIGKNADDME